MKSVTSLPLQIVLTLSKHVVQIRLINAIETSFAFSVNCETELKYTDN